MKVAEFFDKIRINPGNFGECVLMRGLPGYLWPCQCLEVHAYK